jgi:hypothetical protein
MTMGDLTSGWGRSQRGRIWLLWGSLNVDALLMPLRMTGRIIIIIMIAYDDHN